MRIGYRLSAFTLIAGIFSACAMPQPSAQPGASTSASPQSSIPTAASTQTTSPTGTTAPADETPAASATAPSTETPEPTEQPAATAVLPMPVLFLSDQSGSEQIWRMDTDGKTLTQLTDEAAPVTDFDVSRPDGRLIYVSDNDLIIADVDGSNRAVLVDGPPKPAIDATDRINREMRQPRWSPDGTQIAFGLGGVHVISASGGVSNTLVQSDPMPQPPNYQAEGPVQFYWPNSWSFDGSRVLAEFAYFPEAGGLAVITVNDKTIVDLTSPEGIVCCHPAWSADSSAVYIANSMPGMIAPGLWRADASTGQSTTLITGITESRWQLVAYPWQASDGMLYYFFATQPLPGSENEPMPSYVPLAMYRSAADGLTGQTQLRNDAYVIGDAAWAPDNSGAIIVDAKAALEAGMYPPTGTLLYLKTDGSAAVQVAEKGRMPRWGARRVPAVSNGHG